MSEQSKKLNLLLAIHCHQPVSNFLGIFQDAFEKAYLPFLDVFEDFSDIKIALHYSGSLLDWLIEKHPEFIKRLRHLLEEKRIELICGGYFEPILSIIPERDAVGQITLFREKIKEVFGRQTRGVWLTERVWEPKLPKILAEAGVEFTIVDDYHFKILGMDTENLSGYYICEEELKKVLIFPGSEKLRYLMPFKLPFETINYLKDRFDRADRSLAITFADDGEKFGLWPGTNKWVYREGWLKNFFVSLEENKDWLTTLTFSEYINKSQASGRVYLPCASYKEMQEWSRGYFRNFLIKYPEANNMQKKMFLVSDKLDELKNKSTQMPDEFNSAKQHLYKGQFNDAYWHGIFGGLYMAHLRSGVYEHLIKAENLIEKFDKQNGGILQCDFDKDGKDELIVSNKKMRLYFRPKEGATISEWDDKARCVNLNNTISRRFEYYHQQLKEKIANSYNQNPEPKTIHEQRPIKQEGLGRMLLYDIYNRYSLRNYLLDKATTLDDFYASSFKEAADFSSAAYEWTNKSDDKKQVLEFSRKDIMDMCVLKLTKMVSVVEGSICLEFSLENFGARDLNFIFGTEFNLSLYDSILSTTMDSRNDISDLAVHDLWKNIKIEFSLKPCARLWHFPVQTVSDSDQGIEKSYQELCLFFNWPVSLRKESNLKFRLEAQLS